MRLSATSLSFLFLLSACSRSSSSDPVQPPTQPAPATGSRLARVYLIDSTQAAPRDTVARAYVTYDASGRPKQWASTAFAATGDTTYYSSIIFEYNGTDTLASRKVRYRKQYGANASVNTDTSYYQYVNGRRSYDSTRSKSGSNSSVTVSTRTFPGNYIAETRRVSSNSGGTIFNSTSTRNIYQQFSGGRLSNQVDTSVTQTGPNTYSYFRFEANLSYINTLNPMYQVLGPGADEVVGDDLSNFSEFAAPRFLYAGGSGTYKSWSTGQSGSTNTIGGLQFAYTMRPDGRPEKIREYRPGAAAMVTYLVYE